MAGCGNVPDQSRIPLGHPSQHEEGALDTRLLEDREQPVSVCHHARFARTPALAIDAFRQRRYVEVVLNVNGQRVGDARRRATALELGLRDSPLRRAGSRVCAGPRPGRIQPQMSTLQYRQDRRFSRANTSRRAEQVPSNCRNSDQIPTRVISHPSFLPPSMGGTSYSILINQLGYNLRISSSCR